MRRVDSVYFTHYVTMLALRDYAQARIHPE